MERRKDNKGRVLKEGESQRKDGLYQYRWTDKFGKRHTMYANDLKALRDKSFRVWRGTSRCDNNNVWVDKTIWNYSQKIT